MTDRPPNDEDDLAWLLARERGDPGPRISDARVGRYAQLGTLIADLPAMPAGTAQRTGWEQGVLAVIDAEAGRPADQSATSPTAVIDKPLPKEPSATRRHRRRAATATAAVFVMVASVVIVVFIRRDRALDVDPEQPGRSGSQKPAVEVTRGMHVEQARLGFDHALQVRRSTTAVPHERERGRELRDGDTVMTGDRIRASVITSVDAYLYLASCADQHLQKIYPSQRDLRTRAGDLVLVPDGGGWFSLEGHPGSEVLYLIVSRNELSLADPRLAALILTADDRTKPVDCGASLDMRLTKSGVLPPTNVLRGEVIPKKRMPRSGTGAPEDPDLVGNPGDIVWYTAEGGNGPRTVVAVDADGIAIVRYRYIHVAPEHVDDHTKASDD